MARRLLNEDPPSPWYDLHDRHRTPRGALSWPLAASWEDLWFALDDGFVTELGAA